MADKGLDLSKLPQDVRTKLAELDLELSEGDITQKGYEKKRSRLLAPHHVAQGASVSVVHIQNVQNMAQMEPQSTPPRHGAQTSSEHTSTPRVRDSVSDLVSQFSTFIEHAPAQAAPSPSTAAQRRAHRRLTREDNRYHSDDSMDTLTPIHQEIRTEAVMQALAMHKKQSMVPMPSKRTSVYNHKQQRQREHASDTSSDDDSIFGDERGSRQLVAGQSRQQVAVSSRQSQQQPAAPPSGRDRHASDSSQGSNVSYSSNQAHRSSAIYANVNIPPASGGSPASRTSAAGADLDVVQGSRPQQGQPGSALADVIQISKKKKVPTATLR